MNSELLVEKRAQYREWMNRSIGFGVVGLFVAFVASLFVSDGRPERLFLFAGVGLYYLGFIGYLVIWQRTGVRLFDEREAEIERRAGQIVMLLVTVITIFGIPADVVLDVTGVVTVPPAIRGVIWGYFALGMGFIFAYWYVKQRYA